MEGLGQYLAELTTAVEYGMDITHVVLHNSKLGKISREQIGAIRPVWQTSLHNPNFAEFAGLCGAHGARVTERGDLEETLGEALATKAGTGALVSVEVSARTV